MSTLKVDTLQTTSGDGLYPARSWVSFNGSGAVAILDDGGVSSITDITTGTYGTNLSPVMASANYAISGLGKSFEATNQTRVVSGAGGDEDTTSVMRVSTLTLATSASHVNGVDTDYVALVVHI